MPNGTTSPLAAAWSLQAPTDGRILMPRALYDFAQVTLQRIDILFVSVDDAQEHILTTGLDLEEWYASLKCVQGTQSYHSFVDDTPSLC